jgi:hypothetical protein
LENAAGDQKAMIETVLYLIRQFGKDGRMAGAAEEFFDVVISGFAESAEAASTFLPIFPHGD